MGLTGRAQGRELLTPVWLATGAAVIAMYASGIVAMNRYVPAAHGVVTRVTVVSITDSDYRRCGRADYPEVIVTFRPASADSTAATFTDQMCLFDVRVGDTVTVARQADGDVYVDPITTFTGVLLRVTGWTAAAWVAVFGATSAGRRLDAHADLRKTRST